MRRWRKYAAFAHVGAARAVSERGEIYGRMLFLPVVLGVFSALWGTVAEAGTRAAHAPHALVWYLAITEWIVLSPPLVFVEIQEEILRGDLATHLPRPVSYVGAVFCQAVGMLCVRGLVLGVFSLGFAYFWTGVLPDVRALACALPLGFVSQLLITLMYVGLGLTAFWFVDATPLYIVWQKALFIVGGLMLPLEFYPAWVQHCAAFTPFPSMLSGPAGVLLHAAQLRDVARLVARQVLWFGGLACMTHWLFQRALRRLQLAGG